MKCSLSSKRAMWPVAGWASAALAGVVAPALAMLLLAVGSGPLAKVSAPVLAIGLMGAGMIAAALTGRLGVGAVLALLSGLGLALMARGLGLATFDDLPATALAFVIASISFAARGALFARSGADRGWWIAVAVVAGEAAMLFTAAAMPGALPEWLLVLLPAQWASSAIRAAITGASAGAAAPELFALAATAAATMLVVRLWPRRWTYGIMFSTWLACAALVWRAQGGP